MKHEDNLLKTLSGFYQHNARDLPWRTLDASGNVDPYAALVSEFMLQQTQVNRVMPKYNQFMKHFPTIDLLACAQLSDVISLWSGLGYNRRARYIWEAAQNLRKNSCPWRFEELTAQKGIGINTAAAILVYGFNQQLLFVETNIRTVVIHHFFPNQTLVTDTQIINTLSDIVPWHNNDPMSPRDFYWSLMDYGTYLKSTIGNASIKSKTYKKQSAFEGSIRQIRGEVIRILIEGPVQLSQLELRITDVRLHRVLEDLKAEGLIRITGKTLMLYNEKNH